MITISLLNNKGGVAKTTTAITTASCLVQFGKRVLLVDMDPQANCSDAAGVYDGTEEAKTIFGLLSTPLAEYEEESFQQLLFKTIQSSPILGCDVIPSNILLDEFQDRMATAINREYRLKKVLSHVKEHYDYCLIDCPPSLSILTINALTASDYMVIPCDSSKYALTGMGNLIKKYKEIRNGCNEKLELLGILNTKVESRSTTSKTSREKLVQYFGKMLFDTYIPKNISVEKSQYESQSLFQYDKNSPAYEAYHSFTKEMMERVEK